MSIGAPMRTWWRLSLVSGLWRVRVARLEWLGIACLIAGFVLLGSPSSVLFPAAFACGLLAMRGYLRRVMPTWLFWTIVVAVAIMLVGGVARQFGVRDGLTWVRLAAALVAVGGVFPYLLRSKSSA